MCDQDAVMQEQEEQDEGDSEEGMFSRSQFDDACAAVCNSLRRNCHVSKCILISQVSQ